MLLRSGTTLHNNNSGRPKSDNRFPQKNHSAPPHVKFRSVFSLIGPAIPVTWCRIKLLLSGDIHPNPGPHNFDWWAKTHPSSAPSSSNSQQIPPTKQQSRSLKILQFNANGISSKVHNIVDFMQHNNIKIAAIQETKWHPKACTPKIDGYSFIRADRPHNHGGGLAFIISKEIQYNPVKTTISDEHTEHLAVDIHTNNTDTRSLRIHNVYIPPCSSCGAGYCPNITTILQGDDYTVLGDFNAHNSLWDQQATEDVRGQHIADQIDDSPAIVINNPGQHTRIAARDGTNIATSPDITICSPSIAASTTWKVHQALGSDHLPIIAEIAAITCLSTTKRQTFINYNKARWYDFSGAVDSFLKLLPPPTNIRAGELRLREAIHTAAAKFIPAGRIPKVRPFFPATAAHKANVRDYLQRTDPINPKISSLTRGINNIVREHRRQAWLGHLDKCAEGSKQLWTTIKAINGQDNKNEDNIPLIIGDKPSTDNNKIATKFNAAFHLRPQGKPINSARAAKRHIITKAKTSADEEVTAKDVEAAIKSSKNSKAIGPDGISTLHLKNLGPIALEYIAKLFNISINTGIIPQIWRNSKVIPIPKPGKDSSSIDSYRPISLLSPIAKTLERIMLPQVQKDLASPTFQHGFKKEHSTTTALASALDTITNGLNNRTHKKAPPKRSVVVALDLSKAFDTVDHRLLISDIAKTTLHPKLQRWISNYLMGRQAKVEFRGCTSKTRVIRQGVPQGGVISPQLFTFYIANMPTPPNNIQVITYADDITIISSDIDIAKASKSIEDYLAILIPWLEERKLQLSAPKSSVTVFSSAAADSNIKPKIKINNTIIPVNKNPKILGVTFDPLLTFKTHANNIHTKVKQRNNALRALAGTTWGKSKEILRTTFKAIGRSVINYAAPIWSPSLADTHWNKLQTAQNSALRSVTGCVRMSPIDHLHAECKMMPVKEHNYMLAKQFLFKCQNNKNHPNYIPNYKKPTNVVKHNFRTKFGEDEPCTSSHTHNTRSSQKKASQKAEIKSIEDIHTQCVNDYIETTSKNKVIDSRPPDINDEEKLLPRETRSTLAQLRSGYSSMLNDFQSRISNNKVKNRCPNCRGSPHDTNHLFNCSAAKTTLNIKDLWNNPIQTSKFLNLPDEEN